MRRDLADDTVFVNALFGAFGVAHGVAPAGMQQAVITSARASRQIAHLGEHDAHAAQRQIPRDAAAGRPAAND